MPNFKVFNDQRTPLYHSAVNNFNFSLKSTGFSRGDISIVGIIYCAVSGVVTLSQNNYYAFYFSNPSGSGKTAQYDIIECSTKQMLSVSILKGITSFTSTGTLEQCNFNASFSDNSIFTTVQIASNVSSNPVAGGTSICNHLADINFDINYDGAITLPPGYNIAVSIQNKGSAGDAAFNVMWWEIEI